MGVELKEKIQELKDRINSIKENWKLILLFFALLFALYFYLKNV